jgi:hypothetical protein
VEKARVLGLKGLEYLDKVRVGRRWYRGSNEVAPMHSFQAGLLVLEVVARGLAAVVTTWSVA